VTTPNGRRARRFTRRVLRNGECGGDTERKRDRREIPAPRAPLSAAIAIPRLGNDGRRTDVRHRFRLRLLERETSADGSRNDVVQMRFDLPHQAAARAPRAA
jgi:hypothetical protein